MRPRFLPLNARQLEVLRWVADGCPDRSWPNHSHKLTARMLQSRGLADVAHKRDGWAARLTDSGRYYLEHGRYPPQVASRTEPPTPAKQPRAGGGQRTEEPPTDTPVRVMRQVASRKRPSAATPRKREIRETFMRYKVVVTRVQVAERFVRAPTEEDAAAKMQEEVDRPYGYFGSWKTTATEIDVVEAEETTVIHPTHLSSDGPMLLSIKDAAKALGITYSTLYQMINQGDVEHVQVGSRKYLAREKLLEFIEHNTHKGYYRAR